MTNAPVPSAVFLVSSTTGSVTATDTGGGVVSAPALGLRVDTSPDGVVAADDAAVGMSARSSAWLLSTMDSRTAFSSARADDDDEAAAAAEAAPGAPPAEAADSDSGDSKRVEEAMASSYEGGGTKLGEPEEDAIGVGMNNPFSLGPGRKRRGLCHRVRPRLPGAGAGVLLSRRLLENSGPH